LAILLAIITAGLIVMLGLIGCTADSREARRYRAR
jgi:hypothetical protein